MKKLIKFISAVKKARKVIAFFAFIALPLVFIISAIAIASVLIIGVPFVLIALLIYFIIRNNS